MHHGRSVRIQSSSTRFHGSAGTIRTRSDSTASIAGRASSSMRQNHWSEISGSIGYARAVAVPDGVDVRLALRDRAELVERRHHRLRAPL